MSEFSVVVKNAKVSPKKLRFLLDDVKKQKPVEAVHTLMYTSKKGAEMLRKAIASALANAKNTMNVDESLLQFKTIIVEEGLRLKRYRAGGRGMAKPFRRKYSHIKVILTTREQVAKPIIKADEVSAEPLPRETQNVKRGTQVEKKKETKASKSSSSKLKAKSSK